MGEFEFLLKEFKKLWPWKNDLNLFSLGHGFYGIHCSSKEEQQSLTSCEPITIQSYHLWIQPWKAGFKPSQTSIEEGAIWLTIIELPLELYDTQILFLMGNYFGKTIRIDANSIEGLK
ncbi:Holliday junction ATP-dependent DNA helicase RuvB [Bienertia sinuspersici]